jgi:hypothetical protein
LLDSGNPTPLRQPDFGYPAWCPDRDRSGWPRSSRARSRPDCRHRARGAVRGRQAGEQAALASSRCRTGRTGIYPYA